MVSVRGPPVNRRSVDISSSVLFCSERLLRLRRSRDPWIGVKARASKKREGLTYGDASCGIRWGDEQGGEERGRIFKHEEVDDKQHKDAV